MNGRYGSPLRTPEELAQFVRLLGGHPYLVQRGFEELINRGSDIAALERDADQEDGIFGDHLRRILILLVKDPELCDVVRGILRGNPPPTERSFHRLRAGGLIIGAAPRESHPRCLLYVTYLKKHLL